MRACLLEGAKARQHCACGIAHEDRTTDLREYQPKSIDRSAVEVPCAAYRTTPARAAPIAAARGGPAAGHGAAKRGRHVCVRLSGQGACGGRRHRRRRVRRSPLARTLLPRLVIALLKRPRVCTGTQAPGPCVYPRRRRSALGRSAAFHMRHRRRRRRQLHSLQSAASRRRRAADRLRARCAAAAAQCPGSAD